MKYSTAIGAEPDKALQNVNEVLNFMPEVMLNNNDSIAFCHGQIVKIEKDINEKDIAVYNENKNLIGIATNIGKSLLKPVKVFNF